MSINNLPNECLWMIFGSFFNLEELIKLSKVCSRWSNLISVRFSRIKYLFNVHGPEENTIDHIDHTKLWIRDPETIKDHNLRELLPNLRILDISDHFYECGKKLKDFSKVINNNKQLKGLIGLSCINYHNLNLENIEMVEMDEFDFRKVFRPDQLKQIYFHELNLRDLPQYVAYFPNLKRLNLTMFDELETRYNGPELSNLKILESHTFEAHEAWSAFHLMDSCPSLESAFINSSSNDHFIDLTIKNYNLRDLVIEMSIQEEITWSFLRELLSKYPNLHNLAIRMSDEIEDCHVEELVEILPEVKLLDLRGSEYVTQKSADFLSEYCAKSSRSIKIYYDCEKEPIDWPNMLGTDDSIVYGFDFMKHCFYKMFCDLPILIDE